MDVARAAQALAPRVAPAIKSLLRYRTTQLAATGSLMAF